MNPVLEGISEPLAILLSWRTCRLGSVAFSLTFIHFHSFSLSVYWWKTPRSFFIFIFLIKPWVSSLHKRGIHYLALCPHFVSSWSLLFILCDKTGPFFFLSQVPDKISITTQLCNSSTKAVSDTMQMNRCGSGPANSTHRQQAGPGSPAAFW